MYGERQGRRKKERKKERKKWGNNGMEKREGWEGGRQIEDEVEVYGWRDDRGGGKGRMNGMGRLRKRWRCMDGTETGEEEKAE